MRKAIVTAVVMLAGSGIAAAQTGTPQTNNFVTPPARNLAINPSAAGLSHGRMAAPNPAGPEGEQRTASRGEITEAQARRSLRYYGYTGIVNLHVDQSGHWQAQATHNGRRVKVALDDRGTAAEQK
jgi:predicted aspartyl protease